MLLLALQLSIIDEVIVQVVELLVEILSAFSLGLASFGRSFVLFFGGATSSCLLTCFFLATRGLCLMTAVVLNWSQAVVDFESSQHRLDHVVIAVQTYRLTSFTRLVNQIFAFRLSFCRYHWKRRCHALCLQGLLLLNLSFPLLSCLLLSQFLRSLLITFLKLFSLLRLCNKKEDSIL